MARAFFLAYGLLFIVMLGLAMAMAPSHADHRSLHFSAFPFESGRALCRGVVVAFALNAALTLGCRRFWLELLALMGVLFSLLVACHLPKDLLWQIAACWCSLAAMTMAVLDECSTSH